LSAGTYVLIYNNTKNQELEEIVNNLDDVEINADEIDGDSVQAKIDILKKRL
jgi:hypothetical protein